MIAVSGVGTVVTRGAIEDLDPNPRTVGELWYGRPGQIGEIHKMRKDGIYTQGRDSAWNPVIGADWQVHASKNNQQPIDREIADFLQDYLIDRHCWSDVVTKQLEATETGCSLIEVLDDIKPISGNYTNHPGNGLGLIPTDYLPIEMWSVSAWNHKKPNPRQLESIEQNIPGSDTEDSELRGPISMDNIVRITQNQEGSDVRGHPTARACWEDWNTKHLLTVIGAMAHERHHLGIPLAHVEGELAPEEKKVLRKVMRNMRANQHGYAIMPNGVKFEWSTVNGRQITNIEESIWRCNFSMCFSWGGAWLFLGAKQTGAYNVGDKQSENQHQVSKRFAGLVENAWTKGSDGQSYIRRLIDANYGKKFDQPKMKAANLPSENIQKIATHAHNLTQSGHLTPDDGTEDWWREKFRMPPRDPNTARKASSVTVPASIQNEPEPEDEEEPEQNDQPAEDSEDDDDE